MTKAKHISPILGLVLTMFLTGCGSTFTNLTSTRVEQNDSNIYTFRYEANLTQPGVVQESVQGFIAINGEEYPMIRDRHGRNRFSFDYRLPPGQSEVKYYFRVTYETIDNNIRRQLTRYSIHGDEEPHVLRIVNRFPIQIVPGRGPVGANISIVGRGFSQFDRVVFNDEEATTVFEAPTSLRFTVPSVPADRSYEVYLRTGTGDLRAGLFRVDSAVFTLQPDRLDLSVGERSMVIVRIPFAAPDGGLPISVTTDLADQIIMPEVVVPAGARSVNVQIEADAPGQGTLYFEANGFTTSRLPVSIQ